MASEDAPLLVDHTNDVNRNDPYSRFSMAEKRTIVIVVSFVGLVPLFVRGAFVPSIPQIAEDLHISASVVRSITTTVKLLSVV